MATILFVRVKSELDENELERRLLDRKPKFHDVPGLVQKIYGRDETTGDMCGIYFFESEGALANFRESELALTIPAVTDCSKLNGEPMATTHSPGRSASLFPNPSVGKPFASILSKAMSIPSLVLSFDPCWRNDFLICRRNSSNTCPAFVISLF